MSNGFSKLFLGASALLALPLLISGCGSTQKSSVTSSSISGGGGVSQRSDEYKAQDAQLVERSNNITVYSAPDVARKAMHRQPDEVVDEGAGVEAHYYNADNSPTSERLRLRYSGNRLIGKEILPPDANATVAVSRTKSNAPVSNDANYVDMREYNPKNAPRKNPYGASNSSDNANAAVNNDFNAKLSNTSGR